jgi:myosin heavy subunit
MLSPEDTTDTTTGPYDRSARIAARREIINEKRQRQTDILPRINSETPPAGKLAARQLAHLREENKRLRWDLEDMERLLAEYKQAIKQLERENASIRNTQQVEIEQYQEQLRDMMEEQKQLQEINVNLERRYQELYHSFHQKVEEEAQSLVSEAARTLVLSPDHTPPILHDVVKTLELQVKQIEDQHVAEVLRLMRQAQHKAQLLEQELASERASIDQERQNLIKLQNSVREQALLRYKVLDRQLKSRWVTTLTLIAVITLIVLPILQLTFHALGLPLLVCLFLPVILCIPLAYFLAHTWATSHAQEARKKQADKVTVKLPNPNLPDKSPLKAGAK